MKIGPEEDASSESPNTLDSSSPANSPDELDKYTLVQYRHLLVGKATHDANLRAMIMESCWAVGVEPEVETMRQVMEEKDPDVAIALFHSILTANRINLNELKEKVEYFRLKKKFPKRPEGLRCESEMKREQRVLSLTSFTPPRLASLVPATHMLSWPGDNGLQNASSPCLSHF